ncbi:MAG: nuclear transport factor 2 family protein [Fuerstiella sp.]|nr:nuclear transport factor 2 family protein [Fuerstiella sp.]
MKSYFVLFICTLCLTDLLSAEESTPTPLDVVKKRTSALNDHNLESFLATYAEDVAVFVYPDRPLGKGKAHVRKIFAPMIKKRNVHVEIDRTMTADSFVVVEMRTSFGDIAEPSVAIYEVRDGLIQSVRFLRDSIRARQIETNKKIR